MSTIVIRRGEPGDWEAIHEIYSQPAAIAGTLQLPYPAQHTWKERMADPPEGLIHLVAELDGRVVGQLGLFSNSRPRRRHSGHLGMAVHDDWHGKGVGTALLAAALELADGWLGLTRLELTVFTDNSPALALYRKVGFEVEGTHRKWALRDGVLHDVHAMARFAPEK